MAAKRAKPTTRKTQRGVALPAAVITVLLLVQCTSEATSDQAAAQTPATPTATPHVATPEPRSTVPAATGTPGQILPRPTLVPLPPATDEAIEAALAVERAPLGTFVVAKPAGGVPFVHPPLSIDRALYEIPVYDEPFGEPRVLVDGDGLRFPLLHAGKDATPLVLRVVAGDADDEWVQVQTPVLPHGQTVWVQSLYFDFDFTTLRIEADLASGGHIRMVNGGAIVAHGRLLDPSRSKPELHGVGVVGGDGSFPSLGGALMKGDLMRELVPQTPPGTPVLVFDSSNATSSRGMVSGRSFVPAVTVSFTDTELIVGDALPSIEVGRWQHCARELVCSQKPLTDLDTLIPVGTVSLMARPDVGQELVGVGDVVPVYDEPGGPKRQLVDYNVVENIEMAYPTLHPTLFRQPLVLRVLQGGPGDDFVLVQAPTRPHRQSVWVRAQDFEWRQSLNRIEVDLGRDGLVTLFEDDEIVISSLAVYGRQSRPTVLHDTYVEQAFGGEVLSPAYGSHILTLASYSQALSTYGGGMPGQSLHGTNQPELIGQRVSSGGIRVPDEVIEVIYNQPGIVGAGVIIFDSSEVGREAAIQFQRSRTWFPARTTTFPRTGLAFTAGHSYS